MKKLLALVMAVLMMATIFAGCGDKAEKMIVVAEKESAGEEVAQKEADFEDYKYTAVDTQSKALTEVKSGTADAAVVDYVMSIGSIGEGTDYADLVVEGDGYSEEEYGIAFRKGSDLTAKINEIIRELKADGTLKTVAEKYKLQDILLGDKETDAFVQSETDSDYKYVMDKGELVIGITYFAPMNYENEDGELVGFETEFAKAVCAKLGVNAKFQEISWAAKETELEAKNIDCIWNGMTITEKREENMSVSIPYMQNKQVKVVKSK
ncbi:MAG: transporter substrate-binding domain-containing protein [Ruminococcaceae bacterium]|nr:transporter substrate-binding domain-containing protein [Oscillospiraceae bacterium]